MHSSSVPGEPPYAANVLLLLESDERDPPRLNDKSRRGERPLLAGSASFKLLRVKAFCETEGAHGLHVARVLRVQPPEERVHDRQQRGTH